MLTTILTAITSIGTIVTGVVLIFKKIDAAVLALKPTQDQINQKMDTVIASQKQQAEMSGRPV